MPTDANTPMSPEAWSHLRIATIDEIRRREFSGTLDIGVTVINPSAEPLEPVQGAGIELCCRALDGNGNPLQAEASVFPLTSAVPPGELHHQILTLPVPAASGETAKAIRISLRALPEYPEEDTHPWRSRTITLGLVEGPQPAQEALEEASRRWPMGAKNKLLWPYGSLMVAESLKLLYAPVALCAVAPLKTGMARLANIPHVEEACRLGIHMVTDRFSTGLLLKDKSIDQAREILASEDYVKFAVLRDPLERVVSAYLDRFVHHRLTPGAMQLNADILGLVQGLEQPDHETGISFGQFVRYLLAQDPYDLDPHWRPQYTFLQGIPHLTRLYRLEQPAAFEEEIGKRFGLAAALGAQGVDVGATVLEGAQDLLPTELQAQPTLNHRSFLAGDLLGELEGFYRQDIERSSSTAAPAERQADTGDPQHQRRAGGSSVQKSTGLPKAARKRLASGMTVSSAMACARASQAMDFLWKGRRSPSGLKYLSWVWGWTFARRGPVLGRFLRNLNSRESYSLAEPLFRCTSASTRKFSSTPRCAKQRASSRAGSRIRSSRNSTSTDASPKVSMYFEMRSKKQESRTSSGSTAMHSPSENGASMPN